MKPSHALLTVTDFLYRAVRACSKSGILALQTPKFYLAGSKRARKSGFLRSIDRKNQQFEQALRNRGFCTASAKHSRTWDFLEEIPKFCETCNGR
jgi:hypothetical protein